MHPLLLADVVMPSLFIGSGFGRIGCFLFGCCFGSVCAPDMPLAVYFPEDSNTYPRLFARSAETGQQLTQVDGVPVSVLGEGEELPRTESGRARLMVQKRSELRAANPDATFTTVAVHPAQLYSSALAFTLAGFLMWLFPRRKFDGFILAISLMLYAVNRFVLEVVRDDEPGRLDTGFTFSQLVSFGMLALGGILFIEFWVRSRKTTEPTAE